MAWQTPKTNWTGVDGVTAADLNRIEENTRILSATSGLFVDAVRVAGTNNYTLTFPIAPTLAKGFTFNVSFPSTNDNGSQETKLIVNGSTYTLSLFNAGSVQARLPRNWIRTDTIYSVIFTGAYFILREDAFAIDQRPNGYVYYVDPWNTGTSFSTISDAINNLKKLSLMSRTIRIKAPSTGSTTYNENITIQGFHGAELSIEFDENVTFQGSMNIMENTAPITIQGASNGNHTPMFNTISAWECTKLYISQMIFGMGGLSSGGIWAFEIAQLMVRDTTINNKPTMMTLNDVGAAHINDLSGTGNTSGLNLTRSTVYLTNYSGNAATHTRVASQIIV